MLLASLKLDLDAIAFPIEWTPFKPRHDHYAWRPDNSMMPYCRVNISKTFYLDRELGAPLHGATKQGHRDDSSCVHGHGGEP